MLIRELRENPVYIFLLIFLFIGYIGLHMEYPDKDAVFSHLGLDWQQLKDEFYDENGDMYFLLFDSYYYLNEAKQDKELDSGGFLSWLVRLDYRLNDGRILFTPYISFFFGALVLFLVFYIAFLYSESFYLAWLAAAFLMFDKYFFSITLFYFLDTNVLNVFFTLMIFLCILKIINNRELYNILFWMNIGGFSFVLFMLTWSGWFIILVFLFILSSLCTIKYWYIFSFKKRVILFLSFAFLSLLGGYFSVYIDIFSKIKDYLTFDSLRIAELGFFDFDVFYSFFIGGCIIFSLIFVYYFNKHSKEIEMKYILLYSFLIPLMFLGISTKRFIIFFLPFGYILMFVEFKILCEQTKNSFWVIPKKVFAGLFVIILIFVYSNNIGSYNGLLYGFPVVEDSLVEIGKQINKNMLQSCMINVFWDVGIFHEYFANRTAKYKSSPMMMKEYSQAILSENLTKDHEFLNDGIIVIDTHIKRQIPNIENYAKRHYTNKTLLYHFLQGKSFENYSLVYKEVGIRDTYYVYDYSNKCKRVDI